jgi:arabinose-5-phosphate isomerase
MSNLKELIKAEVEAIENIPLNGEVEAAVDLIYQNIHKRDGKVVVAGVGKAGYIGYLLSTKLCSTGTPASFIHPLEAQHGDLGALQKNDVLFLISNSGLTREVIEMSHLSRDMYPEIAIIVLTKNPSGDLGQIANVTIPTGDTIEICPLGLTPTVSTTAMSVISDLIVVTLMKKINFTKEMYSLRHHSGYLGEKARS